MTGPDTPSGADPTTGGASPSGLRRRSGRTVTRRTLLTAAAACLTGGTAALTAHHTGTRRPMPPPSSPTSSPVSPPASPSSPASPADSTFPVFAPRLGTFGLVTNEYAYRHPTAALARCSPDWWATSGSLFSTAGADWTGAPDAGSPDPGSDRATGSAVFRLVTRRRDFGQVTLTFTALLLPPTTTARTPARDWDGAHVWLRYQDPRTLYALSFRRRDGLVVIKRKLPPTPDTPAADISDGGVYTTLAQITHPLDYERWHTVRAEAVNDGEGVLLRLTTDGQDVLAVHDPTPGPLAAPGGLGLRADNTQMLFANLLARPASPGPPLLVPPTDR